MARELKNTKKRAPIRGRVVPTVEELQVQVHSLTCTINGLVDRAKWAEEARESAREASVHLAKELEKVRGERDSAFSARLEVARLEGVLQGLERAGKIEAAPPTDQFGFRP